MAGREHAYVLVRERLDEQKPVEREAAPAELARRHLAGHAPAGNRDLARRARPRDRWRTNSVEPSVRFDATSEVPLHQSASE